jgi:hypothetical protein
MENYRKINAKFDSRCAGSGAPIRKGQVILFFPRTGKAFTLEAGLKHIKMLELKDPASGMIQANEDAKFDRFVQQFWGA